MSDELKLPESDHHLAEALATLDSARVFLHDAIAAGGVTQVEEGTLRVMAGLMEVSSGLISGLRASNTTIADLVQRVSELEGR